MSPISLCSRALFRRLGGCGFRRSCSSGKSRRGVDHGRADSRGGLLAVVAVLTVAFGADFADCQCNQIVVSDASYQSTVDGTYKLYMTCNGQWSWIQQPDDGEEKGYIQPVNYIYFDCNATNGCLGGNSSWYIGALNCAIGSGQQVLAKATTSGMTYPYNIPRGYWQEVNGRGFVYTSLTVSCSSAELSALQIACLVCGCIFVVVAVLLAAICIAKIRQRRRMMTSQQARQPRHSCDTVSLDSADQPTVVSVVDGISYVTPTDHSAESRDPSSDVLVGCELFTITALPIEPPLYTTVVDYYRLPPPPPYEQAMNYVTTHSQVFI